MDPANLSKAEQIVLASGTTPQVVVKAPRVMSPEALEKLRQGRELYQAKVKAGLVPPPTRTPRVAPVETSTPTPTPNGPRRFYNTKTRYEFMTSGDFMTTPVPCVYVTEVRPVEGYKGYYLIENLSGEYLNLKCEWVMNTKDAKTIQHVYDVPNLKQVKHILEFLGINLDMEFAL